MPSDKPFRFAFVSNSAQIASTVKAFEDPTREHIEIRLASMEDALPFAKDCLAAGVEVILGGGATGRLLREKLKLPVVTIARRDMDVIRALMRARERSRRIGLTSFGGSTSGVDLMARILDVDVRLLEFRTTPELVAAITKAVQDGYNCIVGGGICKTIAETVGAEGFVVVAVAVEANRLVGSHDSRRHFIAFIRVCGAGVRVPALQEAFVRKLYFLHGGAVRQLQNFFRLDKFRVG